MIYNETIMKAMAGIAGMFFKVFSWKSGNGIISNDTAASQGVGYMKLVSQLWDNRG